MFFCVFFCCCFFAFSFFAGTVALYLYVATGAGMIQAVLFASWAGGGRGRVPETARGEAKGASSHDDPRGVT